MMLPVIKEPTHTWEAASLTCSCIQTRRALRQVHPHNHARLTFSPGPGAVGPNPS